MNHAEMQFLTTEFPYKKQYANFIGGEWVKPVGGEYFDNISPITGEPFTSIPRSREADIELALDAAHRAKVAWGKTSTTERANILNRIADRMEANLQRIAVAETIDNGKPLRETMFFLDLGSLAVAVAHVVQLGTANVTLGQNFDLVDDRRVNREGTLHADAEGNLADGERLADAVALAAHHEALEDLDTGVLAFDDVDVNLDGVTGAELGNVAAQ